jgi:hypothetical protein
MTDKAVGRFEMFLADEKNLREPVGGEDAERIYGELVSLGERYARQTDESSSYGPWKEEVGRFDNCSSHLKSRVFREPLKIAIRVHYRGDSFFYAMVTVNNNAREELTNDFKEYFSTVFREHGYTDLLQTEETRKKARETLKELGKIPIR